MVRSFFFLLLFFTIGPCSKDLNLQVISFQKIKCKGWDEVKRNITPDCEKAESEGILSLLTFSNGKPGRNVSVIVLRVVAAG